MDLILTSIDYVIALLIMLLIITLVVSVFWQINQESAHRGAPSRPRG